MESFLAFEISRISSNAIVYYSILNLTAVTMAISLRPILWPADLQVPAWSP